MLQKQYKCELTKSSVHLARSNWTGIQTSSHHHNRGSHDHLHCSKFYPLVYNYIAILLSSLFVNILNPILKVYKEILFNKKLYCVAIVVVR